MGAEQSTSDTSRRMTPANHRASSNSSRSGASVAKALAIELVQLGVAAGITYLLLREISKQLKPGVEGPTASPIVTNGIVRRLAARRWRAQLKRHRRWRRRRARGLRVATARAPLGDLDVADARACARAKAALERAVARTFRLSQHERVIAADMVDPRDIGVTFASIGGLEGQKRQVRDLLVRPLAHPELLRLAAGAGGGDSLAALPKGLLLYGPPGTGKTMMAKAIARESDAFFINLKLSTVQNRWFGESQKLVRAVFSLARKLQPCVVFIDEIDAFLRTRASSDHAALGNMKAEFMALWDGLKDTAGGQHGAAAAAAAGAGVGGSSFGVVVVGATNRPWDVDPAIHRRMPRQFLLGLPGEPQRAAILRVLLEGVRCEGTGADAGAEATDATDAERAALAARVAALTPRFSGSDLKELVRAAFNRAVKDFVDAKERRAAERRARRRALAAPTKGAASAAEGSDSDDFSLDFEDGSDDDDDDDDDDDAGGGGEGGGPRLRPLGLADFRAAMALVRPVGANAFAFQRHERARVRRDRARGEGGGDADADDDGADGEGGPEGPTSSSWPPREPGGGGGMADAGAAAAARAVVSAAVVAARAAHDAATTSRRSAPPE